MINTSIQLKQKICVARDCTSISFFELTGAYALDNLTGWGTPNPQTGEAVTSFLTFTDPNDTIFVFDNDSAYQFPIADFPTTDDEKEFLIPASEFGNPKLESGIWKLKYTVNNDDGSGDPLLWEETVEQYFLVACKWKSCKAKLFARIDILNDCSCHDEDESALTLFNKVDIALVQLENSVYCGNITLAKKLIEYLNYLCTKSNCNC